MRPAKARSVRFPRSSGGTGFIGCCSGRNGWGGNRGRETGDVPRNRAAGQARLRRDGEQARSYGGADP